MASNIRDKRKARKSSGTIKSNDELYNSLGEDAFDEPDEEELKVTALEYVKRKRLTSIT